jgi:tripartite-type tricarboxylate transporter receptor subunit TctC
MKPPRRRFLHLAAGVVWLPAVSRFAMAQTYPSRPVRIIVAAGAGGFTDITARLIAQWLTERLGQSFQMRVGLELFKMATGLNFARVDYRGEAPALADLLGQQVDVVFASLPGSIEYIRVNRLRPLAITSATRSPALPEIPVIGDFVSGLETSGWFGIVAPKTTPTGIIERLNKEINAALADPTIRVRFLISAQRWFPARPPSSASSSPTIHRNGPK